ncbi:AbrB family transcriptional regulator [Billgrantia tianxiuensis]|jgi:membrane AbrB-like protein|uniref:AbrB family transcriptional regulator n=1 Tax=Billgrantia tianxiuensis TaxID=2497861 RepID=A0A6I6SKK2_9GAMM|nr:MULTISPECIES: AbrB family transcriptional regulator [Halomonas]MCE8032157.1 AbrB family transcriptional regulator [Halomonas sp. MCCC 1A11057]QHC49821.1 AbrB family transcriptional regulator [Halomonas tianxiuensis]
MAQRTVSTLLIGALGGGIAALVSLPMAWMLGPLFAVLIASLAGVKAGIDKRLHRCSIAMLGLFIGNRIELGELWHLLEWYPSVLTMLAYMAVMLAGGAWLFSASGMSRLSAVFCSFPGSMNATVILAERLGVDIRWIAITHAMRLVIVVASAAFMASYLAGGIVLGEGNGVGWQDISLLVLAPASWWLGRLLRFPLPEFLGPMAVGAVLSTLGHGVALPDMLLVATFLVLGSSVGARFAGTPWQRIVQVGRYGLLFGLYAVLMAVVAAWLLSTFTPHTFIAALLALLPGGVGEMAVIAVALDVDPIYVVTHHVLRLLLLILATPFFISLGRRLANKA